MQAVLTPELSKKGPDSRQGRKHRHMGDLLTVLQGQYALQHWQIDPSSLRNRITRNKTRLWDKSAHTCLTDKSHKARQTDTTQVTADSEESVKPSARLGHSRSPGKQQRRWRNDTNILWPAATEERIRGKCSHKCRQVLIKRDRGRKITHSSVHTQKFTTLGCLNGFKSLLFYHALNVLTPVFKRLSPPKVASADKCHFTSSLQSGDSLATICRRNQCF